MFLEFDLNDNLFMNTKLSLWQGILKLCHYLNHDRSYFFDMGAQVLDVKFGILV